MREKLSFWFPFEFSRADGLGQNVLEKYSFATTLFPPFLSLKSSVENWFCGCEVVGDGRRRGCRRWSTAQKYCQFILFAPRSSPKEATVALSTQAVSPGAGLWGDVKPGLDNSETWALLLALALMVTDPTTQSKCLNIRVFIFPLVKKKMPLIGIRSPLCGEQMR